MTECCDEGLLKAYLADSGELDALERARVEEHLAGCGDCRARLEDLRKLEASVLGQMAALTPAQPVDMQAALQKMRLKMREESAPARPVVSTGAASPQNQNRRKLMPTLSFIRPGQRRGLFSGLAAAMLVLSLVAFPSVRAAADSLLQTFRAKSVIFVPVDTARLQQLASLSTDPTALFLSKPSVVGTEKTTPTGSAAEAARLAGFTPEQPATLPGKPASTQFIVHDSLKAQAQVNVETVRQVLSALGITDLTLPDTVGSAPITADMPPFVETAYKGAGYELRLVQGQSPTVNLPKAVELAQLGEIGLRVIGMQPEQARDLSRQIDWSSTLVVPFPANLSDVVRVQVGDAPGLMVTAAATGSLAGGYGGGDSTIIYWQRGGRFYVLQGSGANLNNDLMLVAAKSVR
ncbi:MAG: anti-sigma factor family protein [Chloroflexia bacterium]